MAAAQSGPHGDFIVVMGGAVTAKSEIGTRPAPSLEGQFVEADDPHSSDNVERMRQGTPFTDALRARWLNAMAGSA